MPMPMMERAGYRPLIARVSRHGQARDGQAGYGVHHACMDGCGRVIGTHGPRQRPTCNNTASSVCPSQLQHSFVPRPAHAMPAYSTL